MNLAICSMGEIFGGVERQILDLCQFRSSRGLTPPVVILFFDRELGARLKEAGIRPVILPSRNRYDPGMVGALVEVLRQRRIDVVHAHGYKATIACALAKQKMVFGLVKTEHGKVESTLDNPLAWAKSRFNIAVDQYLTRRSVDSVAYVTNDIGEFFAKSQQGMKRQTVYNGMMPLNPEDYTRPADLPATEFNLGIVGRVSSVKGIADAIKALGILQPLGNVRLKIIGTGDLVGPLTKMVDAKGLSDVVQFLGFRKNIYDYLAHLDVLLMPSYHEGLPYTLLEAMSLARPIVATQVGGLQEVLRDRDNGMLCPPGDPEALARCLTCVMSTPSLAREIGRKAQQDQARFFTLEAMGNKYLEIYEQVSVLQSMGEAHLG